MALKRNLLLASIFLLLSSCSLVVPETTSYSPVGVVVPSPTSLNVTTEQRRWDSHDEMIAPATPESIELPSFCLVRNTDIEDLFYDLYGFGDQACRNYVYSPAGSHLAFVTLEKVEESKNEFNIGPVVYVRNQASQELARIYESKRGFIVHVSWSSDGHLVVSDTDIDGCRGETIVFNKVHFTVEIIIDGMTSQNNWNSDRTAFFTLEKCSPYWATTDYLSGYSFQNLSPFPDISTRYEGSNGIHIINGPDWVDDGSTLMVVMREGNWINDNMDYLLSSSYILVIGITENTPEILEVIFDPSIDYNYHISAEGELEISSTPYEPFLYEW